MKQKGGRNNRKSDQEMIEELIRIVEENSAVTLDEVGTHLSSRLPENPQIGKITVARAVEGQMYSLKLMKDVPEQKKSSSFYLRQAGIW